MQRQNASQPQPVVPPQPPSGRTTALRRWRTESGSPGKNELPRARASYSLRLRHADGQPADSLPRNREHSICDGRCGTGNTRLAHSAGFLVAFHNVGFDLRTLIHSHHGESVKVSLLQTPVRESKLLKESSR